MSTTEGIGGPCPRCGHEECFIRTGTGTWFSYIACPECLFGYGENADTMGKTRGIVTGADLWAMLVDFFDGLDCYSVEDYRAKATIEDEYLMENPFNFEDDFEEYLDTCVAREETVNRLAREHSIEKQYV